MSIAAARSPSPGPVARPCCGGLRRSADSSPFRPAASPLDSPQRSSSVCKNSGRASPRPSCAEKENDPRDAARTHHKVRTSGAGCGGGGGGAAKSFMAPTISAASKAVGPSASPRKRVLGERNDPVPSSPGDLVAHSSKPRGPAPPEAALGAPRRLRLSLDGAPAPPPPAAAPVAASHAARHSFGGDEEAEKVDKPVCSNHHRHHHDAASTDEAAAAPYDPKTNYLSPRPRFLRYKPNPRVEMYRHSGGGRVQRLEDCFASESSSSSEEVDTMAEDDVSEEEQDRTTPGDSTEEETSDLAPAPGARAEPAASALAGVLWLHPAPDSPLARVMTPERKESPRAGGVLTPDQEPAASPAPGRPKKKKRSPLRFLLAPLALVLFMAAAFVCVPPPPGSPVMLNTSLSKVSDFLSVQELHPVELAARLKQWSSSSLDFVTSYWESLASSQEREVFGPHFAANLSAAPADGNADHAVGFYYGAAQTNPISVEMELEIQEAVSESDAEMIAEPDAEEMASSGDVEVEEPIDDAEMEQESAAASVMEEANDFVTSYWESLASSQEREVFGPHFAANLSAAPADGNADHAVGFYYGAAQTNPISVEMELEIQEAVSESDAEMIAEPDAEEMASSGDVEVEEPIDDAEMEQESAAASVMEEANDSVDVEMAEEVSDSGVEEMAEAVSDRSGEEMAAFVQSSGIPSQSAAEPEQAEDMSTLQQDVQTEFSEGDHAYGKVDQEVHHSEKLGSDMWPSYLDKITNPSAVGAVLAVIIVPAALALLYMRQKQARVAMDPNEPVEQFEQRSEQIEQRSEQIEQFENLSGSGSSEGHVVAKSSHSQNPAVEETEKLGGSGASQYSSSLSSGLGRRRKTRGEGSLGLEPVASRRDSTAQSTASYGSFTTYEKIPAKKGNKEDEAMTPVRRSRRNIKTPEA